MSIMGMREWFRKNRVIMLVVGILLLVGLLISYGRFSAGSGRSAADYEKLVEDARTAYAENPSDPATVQSLASILSEYAYYLNQSDADQEEVDAVDNEALKYYDEYYGLMVLDSTAAYQEEPNYANAYMVANYLSQRATVQNNIDGMDGQALTDETNKWMSIAMGHRVDEIKADMEDDPNNSVNLADLADAVAANAYYQHEISADFDLQPAYTEAIDLLQQALDNAPADAEAATLAGYYQRMGSYAYNIDQHEKAEEYYRASLAAAPDDYDANIAMASFFLNEERYDEAIEVLQAYRATLSDDDANAAGLDNSIDYIIGLRDAETGEITNLPEDEDGEAENGEADAQ